MERKWTKGPWFRNNTQATRGKCIQEIFYQNEHGIKMVMMGVYNKDGWAICEMSSNAPSGDSHPLVIDSYLEMNANANLMMAAPDLYEALELCEEVLSFMQEIDDFKGWAAIESARAALARARGEE